MKKLFIWIFVLIVLSNLVSASTTCSNVHVYNSDKETHSDDGAASVEKCTTRYAASDSGGGSIADCEVDNDGAGFEERTYSYFDLTAGNCGTAGHVGTSYDVIESYVKDVDVEFGTDQSDDTGHWDLYVYYKDDYCDDRVTYSQELYESQGTSVEIVSDFANNGCCDTATWDDLGGFDVTCSCDITTDVQTYLDTADAQDDPNKICLKWEAENNWGDGGIIRGPTGTTTWAQMAMIVNKPPEVSGIASNVTCNQDAADCGQEDLYEHVTDEDVTDTNVSMTFSRTFYANDSFTKAECESLCVVTGDRYFDCGAPPASKSGECEFKYYSTDDYDSTQLGYVSIIVSPPPSTAPTFNVSTTTNPTTVFEGNNITFNASINDDDGNGIALLICDNNGFDNDTSNCANEQFCRNPKVNNTFVTQGYIGCDFNTTGLLNASYEWYSYALDDNSSYNVSAGATGFFYLQPDKPVLYSPYNSSDIFVRWTTLFWKSFSATITNYYVFVNKSEEYHTKLVFEGPETSYRLEDLPYDKNQEPGLLLHFENNIIGNEGEEDI